MLYMILEGPHFSSRLRSLWAFCGGARVLINRVLGRETMVITLLRALITLLRSTQEPSSREGRILSRARGVMASKFRDRLLRCRGNSPPHGNQQNQKATGCAPFVLSGTRRVAPFKSWGLRDSWRRRNQNGSSSF